MEKRKQTAEQNLSQRDMENLHFQFRQGLVNSQEREAYLLLLKQKLIKLENLQNHEKGNSRTAEGFHSLSPDSTSKNQKKTNKQDSNNIRKSESIQEKGFLTFNHSKPKEKRLTFKKNKSSRDGEFKVLANVHKDLGKVETKNQMDLSSSIENIQKLGDSQTKKLEQKTGELSKSLKIDEPNSKIRTDKARLSINNEDNKEKKAESKGSLLQQIDKLKKQLLQERESKQQYQIDLHKEWQIRRNTQREHEIELKEKEIQIKQLGEENKRLKEDLKKQKQQQKSVIQNKDQKIKQLVKKVETLQQRGSDQEIDNNKSGFQEGDEVRNSGNKEPNETNQTNKLVKLQKQLNSLQQKYRIAKKQIKMRDNATNKTANRIQ